MSRRDPRFEPCRCWSSRAVCHPGRRSQAKRRSGQQGKIGQCNSPIAPELPSRGRALPWSYRVVPMRASFVKRDVQTLHLLPRYFLALLINPLAQGRLNLQARRCCCSPNVPEHNPERPERFARPVHTDLTEQPIFYGIPLRAPCGVMTDCHSQSKPVAQFHLQVMLPSPRLAPVPAAPVCQESLRAEASCS